MHQVGANYDQLNGIAHVAIFSASVDQLNQHTSKHRDLFPILADENEEYYTKIGVERSWLGMFKGMFGRMPSLIKSMFMGNIPRETGSRMLIMPVDILINEDGKVEKVRYGKDEGDHIPIDEVREFASA